MNEQWIEQHLPCENGSVILIQNEQIGTIGTQISDFVSMFSTVNTTGDVYTQMKTIGEPLGFLPYIEQWHSEGLI